MDPAILPAISGLIGSLIGGASTFAASWHTQRRQLRMHMLVQEATKREVLYAEFIKEASKRLTDAWNHHAEGPDVLAGLYACMERMRLISSPTVVSSAERVIRKIIEAYADHNRTFDEIRKHLEDRSNAEPLKEFTEACRLELDSLRN